jgi:hypothetical protein
MSAVARVGIVHLVRPLHAAEHSRLGGRHDQRLLSGPGRLQIVVVRHHEIVEGQVRLDGADGLHGRLERLPAREVALSIRHQRRADAADAQLLELGGDQRGIPVHAAGDTPRVEEVACVSLERHDRRRARHAAITRRRTAGIRGRGDGGRSCRSERPSLIRPIPAVPQLHPRAVRVVVSGDVEALAAVGVDQLGPRDNPGLRHRPVAGVQLHDRAVVGPGAADVQALATDADERSIAVRPALPGRAVTVPDAHGGAVLGGATEDIKTLPPETRHLGPDHGIGGGCLARRLARRRGAGATRADARSATRCAAKKLPRRPVPNEERIEFRISVVS